MPSYLRRLEPRRNLTEERGLVCGPELKRVNVGEVSLAHGFLVQARSALIQPFMSRITPSVQIVRSSGYSHLMNAEDAAYGLFGSIGFMCGGLMPRTRPSSSGPSSPSNG